MGLVPFCFFESLSVYSFAIGASFFGLPEKVSVLLPHGLACVALPWALYPWLPPSYREAKWLSSGLILGIALSLPVFGPGCVLIILKLLNKLSRGHMKKEESSWVVGSRVPDAEGIDFVSGKDSSDSILQVMNGPDPIARRNLVLATKRLPPSEAVPVLRAGLRDSDEEVKLYSQGILSKLVERYEEMVAKLKKDLLSSPDDCVLLLQLAEQLCEIVELSLVADRELQLFYLESAIKLLEKVHALEPANDHAMALLARYHLMTNDPDAAIGVVDQLRKLGASLDVLEAIEIEALFQKRSWPEFREKLSGVVLNRFYDPHLLNLSEFWVGSPSSSTRGEPVETKFNVLGSS
jgi:tetratricopeptide (TPR) repeat protein